MNNPNPFVPQGSLLEQKNKKRARVKVAVFSIFALNLLVITPLLIQGCTKKDSGDQANTPTPTDLSQATASAPDTNNVPPALPPISNSIPDTNIAAAPIAPPPPPTPIAPPAPQGQDYVVTKGDTYYSIAKKFNIRMSDIKNANPSVNPAKLKVGQKLQIPAAGAGSTGATADAGSSDVYVVKSGDSLHKIAKSNGTTVKAIRALNNLKTDRINVGQKLKVPAKTAAPAPAPADTTAPLQPAPVPAPAPATTAAVPGPTPVSPAGH